MFLFLKYSFYLLLALVAALAILIYLNQAPDRSVQELSQRWAQPPSRFLEIAGMNIHLRDEGPKTDQTPIVLIHGTSASLHTWDGWVGVLKQSRRVIRFDLPGFGLTGPDPSNNYTIEHYAEVLVSVLDELNINQAVLAGNSLGGYVAWASAVLHPTRVSGLVLVDSMGYPSEAKSVPLAFKLSQNPVTSVLLKNVLPRSLVNSSVKNVFGNPDLVTEELVDRYYEISLREGNRDALKERFKQTVPGPLIEKLNTISVPTLVMWGGRDQLITPGDAQRFHQDIANSELVIFGQLGHVPHEEDPQTTVAAVERFLDSKTFPPLERRQ